MSLDLLKATKKKTVGAKQTAKAIEKGTAQIVFVARNADEGLVRGIVGAATARGVEVIYIDSMTVLGRACGIDVGAASAAIIR